MLYGRRKFHKTNDMLLSYLLNNLCEFNETKTERIHLHYRTRIVRGWVSKSNHYIIIAPQSIRGRHDKVCLFTWSAYYYLQSRGNLQSFIFESKVSHTDTISLNIVYCVFSTMENMTSIKIPSLGFMRELAKAFRVIVGFARTQFSSCDTHFHNVCKFDYWWRNYDEFSILLTANFCSPWR